MALTVKDLAVSGEKWGNRAASASSEFAANAQAAADKWGRATQAAQANFQQAITAGNIGQRFARGVQRAMSSGKFGRKLAAVGAGRYSEGVGAGKQDWVSGFEPYHAALQTVTLPPRAPRGDVRNYDRVKAIGQTLNAKRLAMLGTGG